MINQKIPMEEKTETSSKLFNFRPIFFSAVFFILGIVGARVLVEYELPIWTLCFLLPIIAIPFCFVSNKREAKYRAVAVSVLALFFALAISAFFIQTYDFQNVRNYQGDYTVKGRVTKRVDTATLSWLEVSEIRIDGTKERGTLIAYLPADYVANVSLSDRIELFGKVETDTALFDENGFRAYAVEQGSRYYMRVERLSVTGNTFDLFLACRQRLQDVVRSGMTETPAEVLLALLIGETSGIDAGLLENVRYGGIAHVFAVSGLHVGALFACLVFVIQRKPFYRIPKPVRFLILGAILLFYGGICGYTASVVRATVTCLCFYGATLLGVEADGLETISVACICTSVFAPCSVFTAGYQLSFTACYGIVFLARRLEKGIWYIWGKFRAWIGKPVRKYLPHEQTHPLNIPQTIERNVISFLSVTFSAQAFTAPVQLLSFGYLSVWSLLLNCIFVPIIGIVFPVFLLFAVLGLLMPFAGAVILYVPNLVLTLLTLLFSLVDFTAFAVTGIKLTLFTVVCYYFALLLCTDKWNVPKRQLRIMALCMALAFVTGVWIASA